MNGFPLVEDDDVCKRTPDPALLTLQTDHLLVDDVPAGADASQGGRAHRLSTAVSIWIGRTYVYLRNNANRDLVLSEPTALGEAMWIKGPITQHKSATVSAIHFREMLARN